MAVSAETWSPGDDLPLFTRVTGFANWNRYAAVNDEFVPIHMDDGAGRSAGYETAFGMGNLQWSYLHNVLRSIVGDEGRVVSLSCQFRGANLKDQRVSAGARVERVREEDDEILLDLAVWTSAEPGGDLAPGTATVALPRRA
ncbi:hotdog family protein [Nocardiopsis oceani]